jgi:hypothetical protein
VTLGPGQEVNLGDFRLASNVPFVGVSGTVVGEDESPISGARVYVLKTGTSAVFSGPFVTDEQGRLALAVPRDEPITLKVQGRFLLGEASFVAGTDQPALWIVLKPIEPKI